MNLCSAGLELHATELFHGCNNSLQRLSCKCERSHAPNGSRKSSSGRLEASCRDGLALRSVTRVKSRVIMVPGYYGITILHILHYDLPAPRSWID